MRTILRIRYIVDSPGWALDICHSKFGVSRSRLKYLVYLGAIRVNGELLWLGDRWAQQGDYLQVYLYPKRYHPRNLGPRVWQWFVYANDDMLIMDKPAGLPVIAAKENKLECISGWLNFSELFEGIPSEFVPERIPDSLPKDYTVEVPSSTQPVNVKDNSFLSTLPPRIARYPDQFSRTRDLVRGPLYITHRLDVGTHGLLVLSRRTEFTTYFNSLLERHIPRKYYQAVVTTKAWEKFATKYGYSSNNVAFPIVLKHWMTDFSEDNTEEDYLIPSYDYIRRGLRTRPPIGTVEMYPVEAMPEPRRMSLSSTPTPQHTLLCELHILNAQSIYNDITDDLLRLAYSSNSTQCTHMHRATPFFRHYGAENDNNNDSSAQLGDDDLVSEKGMPVPLTRCLPLRPFSLAALNDLYTKYHTPLTLLTLQLLTGRTHQIRAQLHREGLPLLGDWLYRPEPGNGDERDSLAMLPLSVWCPHENTFALCCVRLAFPYDTQHKTQSFQENNNERQVTKKAKRISFHQQISRQWIHIHLPLLPPLHTIANESVRSLKDRKSVV